MTAPVLKVSDLRKHYGGQARLIGGPAPLVKAVDGVSFTVERGKTLGIVGESGCGKSTLGRMLAGLLTPTSGTIELDGKTIAGHDRQQELAFHREVQLVFQDPLSALNPRKTVRQILDAPLKVLREMDGANRRVRVAELMDLVSLRPEFIDRYPHEFSGGQCQRIGIARALAAEPRLMILDEPVSALDVSIQAQVLKLLKQLQERLGLTYVFISHDLAVVENLCTQIAVMCFGKIVEQGQCRDIFGNPQHDYTRTLLSAVPRMFSTIDGIAHSQRT